MEIEFKLGINLFFPKPLKKILYTIQNHFPFLPEGSPRHNIFFEFSNFPVALKGLFKLIPFESEFRYRLPRPSPPGVLGRGGRLSAREEVPPYVPPSPIPPPPPKLLSSRCICSCNMTICACWKLSCRCCTAIWAAASAFSSVSRTRSVDCWCIFFVSFSWPSIKPLCSPTTRSIIANLFTIFSSWFRILASCSANASFKRMSSSVRSRNSVSKPTRSLLLFRSCSFSICNRVTCQIQSKY